ncbi:MAG: efflux RND transporter periplasmic adaptor subunit [Planctomycetaceae bacterium]
MKFVWPIALVAALTTAGFTRDRWWPALNTWVQSTVADRRTPTGEFDTHDHGPEAHDDHAGHDHAGHDEATSLELSEQALRNLGLTGNGVGEIELTTFKKSITVPAQVVERPGRTRIQVATPMNGVITNIHAAAGAAVEPNSLLFEIRLTHEDLVRSQTEFVTTLGELDIEQREIARLQEFASSGGVARKTLLEREYSRDKLQSLLVVQREALRLHGLSEAQVQQIARDRRLLRELKLYSPNADGTSSKELKLSRTFQTSIRPAAMETTIAEPPLILRELLVHRGQAVDAGEPLGTLVNYSELYIEGLAFEQDIAQLSTASRNQWKVAALFDEANGDVQTVPDLEIAYLDTEIDLSSRTLKFYVSLPNHVVSEHTDPDGTRFVNWKFRPGQRLQLRVPVEEWSDQIVLPVDAVAREGADYFVFQQNGDHFDRLPVHVKYRDQFSVVVANDGQLFPGDVVAMHSAHQMQMALRNKAGAAVDPHAGHNH